MSPRELVVTWIGIVAVAVVGTAVLVTIAASLPGLLGAAGDAVGSAVDAVAPGGEEPTGDRAGDSGNASDSGSEGTGDGADAGDEEDAGDGEEERVDPTDALTDTDTAAGQLDDPTADTAGTTVETDDGGDGGNATNASNETVQHETVNVTAVEQGLVDAINDARADEFVGALDTVYEEELWQIAADHADDMANRSYVGVVSPTGETNEDRFDDYRPNCKRIDDYEDAVGLAAGLNYSTRTDSRWHLAATTIVERIVERWDRDVLVDDTYGDLGVAVRHANASDRLYAAAAIC